MTAARPDGTVSATEIDALRDQVVRLQAMADRHPALLWLSDLSGGCTQFNESWLSWRGRTLEQEKGLGWLEGVHSDDTEACMATYRSAFEDRVPFEMEYRLLRADGEYRLILDAGAPWATSDGTFAGFVGSCLDITDSVRTRRALSEGEDLYRATIEALSEGVIITDATGTVLSLNSAATRLIGFASDEVVDQPLAGGDRIVVLSEDGAVVPDHLTPSALALSTGHPVTDVVLGWAMPGRGLRWHLVSSRPLRRSRTNEIFASVTSVVDITDRKSEADAAKHFARHDPLTGLANRTELFERVQSVVDRTVRVGHDVAVAFCDLDNFKTVNDTFGHDAGDEVLRVVCERMAATIRTGDMVARVGGDELVIVLDEVDGLSGAVSAAEKIRTAISRPIGIGDGEVTPTVSIGVALLRPDEDPKKSLARADEAMYAAKERGRNRVVVLGPVS